MLGVIGGCVCVVGVVVLVINNGSSLKTSIIASATGGVITQESKRRTHVWNIVGGLAVVGGLVTAVIPHVRFY